MQEEWIVSSSFQLPADLPASVPKALLALKTALGRAADEGILATAHAFRSSDQVEKVLAKRRHDLAGAVRTLSMAVKSIQDGYKFDDEKAPAKIAASLKALGVIEAEAKVLKQLLSPG